jgi:seryl-tRNA synthetase
VKDIGKKKRAGKDATDLLQQKQTLEETKKAHGAAAQDKEAELVALAKTIGNYVDDSVPV